MKTILITSSISRVLFTLNSFEAGCRKRPELWPDWILHHDNAPAHKQFLAQKLITKMEDPSYSPDLAPNNF
jgi:hypothetical protein